MATITVTNPATGETVGEVQQATAADVDEAFARARGAQRQWAALPVRKRARVLRRFAKVVVEKRDELLDLIQDENGKNRASALEEVMDVALTSLYYAQTGPKATRTRGRFTALPLVSSTREQRPPKGVVGVIAPFNYPLALAVSDAVPALIAGNAVVVKPDSQTPLSALRAAELLREAGLPEDVFIVVPGSGAEVGQAIVRQCDFLMFTGSTATGKKLAAQAGERLIDYSMELGGKNPMIVADDAPLERAINAATHACFANSGQLCISIERIYVHRAVADDFITGFVDRTTRMRVGAGHDWEIDMGSQISKEHTEKIEALVDDALAHGARALTGGHRTGETFFEPTILTDVPADAALYTQEVFGPVVYIEVVDSLDQAVEKANDTEYGLNASVWASAATGRRLAKRLEAGTVNINDGYAPAWSAMGAPMGGWKQSGAGRRHGEHGITKFTEPRNVTRMRGVTVGGVMDFARRRLR